MQKIKNKNDENVRGGAGKTFIYFLVLQHYNTGHECNFQQNPRVIS